MALNPRVVVPGHGPLCDTRGINAVRDYLLFIEKEARGRFDAGKLACVYYSVYDACVRV